MSTTQTRWNLVVSSATDRELRQFLAAEGRGKKGELSRFVEEAVNRHMLQVALQSSRERNKDLTADEVDSLVEESLAWAREKMRQAGN